MVDPPLLVQVVDRFVDGDVEHDRIVESLMGKVRALQIPPAPFNVIEFRCVTREPLHGSPVSHGERAGAGLRGVDRPFVEHQDNWFHFSSGPGSEAAIELLKQRDKVGASFRGRAMHDQFAPRGVK
jgi:hypothetical protein